MTVGVTWGAVVEALPGQLLCGDAVAVAVRPDRALLVGIDGLGHGAEAADAAAIARKTALDEAELSVAEILRRCHRTLRQTRGAAMTVASVTANTLTWAGIGNVEGWFIRANPGTLRRHESAPLRGGVIGYSLPARIATSELQVSPGDLLLMASDGIRLSLAEAAGLIAVSPEDTARALHARFWTRKDDGLVLVARFS